MKLTCIISIAIFAFCRTPLIGADDPSSALSAILKPGKAYLVALPKGTLPDLRASDAPSFERRLVTIVESIGAGWYRVDYEAHTKPLLPDGTGKLRPDQNPESRRALVNFAHASLIEETDEQPATQIAK